MKATEANFLKFLGIAQQFVIPIYQRTYSWTQKQCAQLWDDIVRAATDDEIPGHFIGSIVYIQKGIYQSSKIPQVLVIDGQQRLTTLSLLLHALGQALTAHGDPDQDGITQDEINDFYLFNRYGRGDLHYKLLLTQSDKPTFMALLKGYELPATASRRIVDNYHYFEEQVRKANVDLGTLYRGVAKIIIVDIALEHGRDNPQLIFESLNSTGLELSQADLIRNYILMGLEPEEQTRLYQRYWYPMEQSFGHAAYAKFFDRFMRDYLTVRTGRIPNIRGVYEAFKAYAQSSQVASVDALVADIYRYSGYFVRMALEKEPDRDLRRKFADINTLKVDVAYPLLLEVYEDYEQGQLQHAEFLEILHLVESYVFRRAICGIPTNSLNKTFATLSRELDKTRYLPSFRAALLLKTSYRRFPDDAEFARELVVKDLYNFRSRNYLLSRLENYQRKERVNITDYTIEHIMPQNENLSPAWQAALGPDWPTMHERYLHTLGNLTLTGYNSELSDRPFPEKRDMEGGFADSPLRLNRGLAQIAQWNEVEIQARAQRLANLVLQVWRYPVAPAGALEDYCAITRRRGRGRKRSYTLQDHPCLAGGYTRELFEQFRRRVLNLDAAVNEEILKLYIAYKTTTNFVDVVPQKQRLRLSLNMAFDEIDDPKGLCKDVTGKGRWGNGDVEITLSSAEQLDDVMALVYQSFEKHMDNGDD